MILHNCINCDCFEMIPVADGQLPKMQRYECPECKTIQYIKHSRIQPETYPENMLVVDEKNKTITLKEKL